MGTLNEKIHTNLKRKIRIFGIRTINQVKNHLFPYFSSRYENIEGFVHRRNGHEQTW